MGYSQCLQQRFLEWNYSDEKKEFAKTWASEIPPFACKRQNQAVWYMTLGVRKVWLSMRKAQDLWGHKQGEDLALAVRGHGNIAFEPQDLAGWHPSHHLCLWLGKTVPHLLLDRPSLEWKAVSQILIRWMLKESSPSCTADTQSPEARDMGKIRQIMHWEIIHSKLVEHRR